MKAPKIIFVFITFLLYSTTTQSQNENDYCEEWRRNADTISNSDKLLRYNNKMIPNVDSTCKIKIYLNSAFVMYESKRRIDSSLYFYEEAIKLGGKINSRELLSNAYSLKADVFSQNYQYREALICLKKARKILDDIPESNSWIFYYQSYSEIYDNQGNYKKALKYTDSAISIAKKNNNSIELAVCYHNKGLFNYRLSRFEEASISILDAIRLKESQSKPDGIARTYYLLGNCYTKWGRYRTAIKYLNKSIPLAKKEGNDFLLILNYSYLSDCYRELGENDKALEIIDYTLELAKKLQNHERIFQALNQKGWLYLNNYKQYNIAENYFKRSYDVTKLIKQERNQYLYRCYYALTSVYLKQGKYDKAKEYLKFLEKVIKQHNILNDTQNFYLVSSKYYEKIGKSELALESFKKYHAIKDSISNQQVQTKVADLEKKYDTKKKELEIVNLNQEKEEQQQIVKQARAQQNLYLVVACLLLLLLTAGAWAFRKLRKQQKELVSTNHVKNRLFSIIAHDLRGMIIPFQRSGKILKHHIDKGNHEKTIELSQALEQNSESLSNMLDNLLNWSLEQMNGYTMNPQTISITKELDEIISGYKQQAAYKKTKIDLKYKEDLWINFDKGAFHVIFRNLIGNALKYTEEGNIRIEFRNENDRFMCSVTDTGIGMSQDQLENIFTLEERKSTIGTQGEKGTGLGLNLVYRFIKMHEGIINVSSEKRIGSRFDLSFPIITYKLNEKIEQKPLSA